MWKFLAEYLRLDCCGILALIIQKLQTKCVPCSIFGNQLRGSRSGFSMHKQQIRNAFESHQFTHAHEAAGITPQTNYAIFVDDAVLQSETQSKCCRHQCKFDGQFVLFLGWRPSDSCASSSSNRSSERDLWTVTLNFEPLLSFRTLSAPTVRCSEVSNS